MGRLRNSSSIVTLYSLTTLNSDDQIYPVMETYFIPHGSKSIIAFSHHSSGGYRSLWSWASHKLNPLTMLKVAFTEWRGIWSRNGQDRNSHYISPCLYFLVNGTLKEGYYFLVKYFCCRYKEHMWNSSQNAAICKDAFTRSVNDSNSVSVLTQCTGHNCMGYAHIQSINMIVELVAVHYVKKVHTVPWKQFQNWESNTILIKFPSFVSTTCQQLRSLFLGPFRSQFKEANKSGLINAYRSWLRSIAHDKITNFTIAL